MIQTINLPLVHKMNAIRQFAGDISLRMRVSGAWYVSDVGVEIGGDGFLSSPTQSAPTPELAVEQWWQQHVDDLPEDKYLVASRRDRRKAWRWTGYMWSEVER